VQKFIGFSKNNPLLLFDAVGLQYYFTLDREKVALGKSGRVRVVVV
jgi:hypothetical protein